MANHRIASLLPSESCATATTKVIDVDLNDPISMIQIVHKATSAGTALAAHPVGNLSKIELVDGSDVLISLSGKECQALDYYSTGKMPYNYITDVSGAMAMVTCNLNFGRFLWDSVLALNPARFNNLQLKITHNYQTADTSASAATLEVYGYLFNEKKISPVGFLTAKELYSFTPGAEGSYKYIDLPLDYLTRKYLVMGNDDDYYFYQVNNEVQISEDNGKGIPFDMSMSAWVKQVNQTYRMIEEVCMLSLNTTPRHVYVAPSFGINVHLMPETVTNIISMERADPRNPLAFDITANDEAVGAIRGFQPHGGVPITFGDQSDPGDWYDVSRFKSLKMRIKAGSSGTGGSSQVVTEQLRKY